MHINMILNICWRSPNLQKAARQTGSLTAPQGHTGSDSLLPIPVAVHTLMGPLQAERTPNVPICCPYGKVIPKEKKKKKKDFKKLSCPYGLLICEYKFWILNSSAREELVAPIIIRLSEFITFLGQESSVMELVFKQQILDGFLYSMPVSWGALLDEQRDSLAWHGLWWRLVQLEARLCS